MKNLFFIILAISIQTIPNMTFAGDTNGVGNSASTQVNDTFEVNFSRQGIEDHNLHQLYVTDSMGRSGPINCISTEDSFMYLGQYKYKLGSYDKCYTIIKAILENSGKAKTVLHISADANNPLQGSVVSAKQEPLSTQNKKDSSAMPNAVNYSASGLDISGLIKNMPTDIEVKFSSRGIDGNTVQQLYLTDNMGHTGPLNCISTEPSYLYLGQYKYEIESYKKCLAMYQEIMANNGKGKTFFHVSTDANDIFQGKVLAVDNRKHAHPPKKSNASNGSNSTDVEIGNSIEDQQCSDLRRSILESKKTLEYGDKIQSVFEVERSFYKGSQDDLQANSQLDAVRKILSKDQSSFAVACHVQVNAVWLKKAADLNNSLNLAPPPSMNDEDCANLLEKLEGNKSHISALEKFNTYFESARTFYKGSQDDQSVVNEINGAQSTVAMQEKAFAQECQIRANEKLVLTRHENSESDDVAGKNSSIHRGKKVKAASARGLAGSGQTGSAQTEAGAQ